MRGYGVRVNRGMDGLLVGRGEGGAEVAWQSYVWGSRVPMSEDF